MGFMNYIVPGIILQRTGLVQYPLPPSGFFFPLELNPRSVVLYTISPDNNTDRTHSIHHFKLFKRRQGEFGEMKKLTWKWEILVPDLSPSGTPCWDWNCVIFRPEQITDQKSFFLIISLVFLISEILKLQQLSVALATLQSWDDSSSSSFVCELWLTLPIWFLKIRWMWMMDDRNWEERFDLVGVALRFRKLKGGRNNRRCVWMGSDPMARKKNIKSCLLFWIFVPNKSREKIFFKKNC